MVHSCPVLPLQQVIVIHCCVIVIRTPCFGPSSQLSALAPASENGIVADCPGTGRGLWVVLVLLQGVIWCELAGGHSGAPLDVPIDVRGRGGGGEEFKF